MGSEVRNGGKKKEKKVRVMCDTHAGRAKALIFLRLFDDAVRTSFSMREGEEVSSRSAIIDS